MELEYYTKSSEVRKAGDRSNNYFKFIYSEFRN